MSRRYTDPDLWTKLFGTKTSTKLVAAYLQSSSPNPAGIFRVRVEEIAMKTGLKVTEVESSLSELHDKEVTLWDAEESMVFITGYAQVQGLNPKVSRSINSELVRLGPSPLTVKAAQIPQLRVQDPEGWDRVSVEYAEAMHTLQSVSLSVRGGESEGRGRQRRRVLKWTEPILDAARDHWPRDEGGLLYRFDRADARRELLKFKGAERPTAEEVVQGIERWKSTWETGEFQHKASTFFRERLWEQAANGKRVQPKVKQITAPALVRDLTKGEAR